MKKTFLFTGFLETWRVLFLYAVALGVLGFFAYRLFTYQVVQGAEWKAYADENRTRVISDQTKRGIIYDRNGYVLARNIASYNVVITPADLPGDEGSTQEVYRQLSTLIGVPVSNGELNEETVRNFTPCYTDFGIEEIVYIGDTNAPYDPVKIKCNVDQTTAMIITERGGDLPGVTVAIEPIRDYPTGELTAEIIGFLGPIPALEEQYYRDLGFVPNRDKVGYSGIESTMQNELGGKNGERVVEVDGAGQVIRNLEEPVEPVPGENIKLTIDTRLQAVAKEALKSEINYWNTFFGKIHSNNGVVVAINPKTGEVLALVSYPTYENNRMARVIPADYYNQLQLDPYKPLFNHAISAEHPPGSVFKMPTAIGALNERVIAPEKQLDDPGKIVVEQRALANSVPTEREYVCWEELGHGMVDWLHGVMWSCDVYFYKIGGGYKDQVPNGLNIWRLGEYAKALGYGSKTGIELPGEMPGLIPDPDWKRINQGESWTTGDTYIASMGQGYVLSTPLQVVISAAILANDGKYMQPTLIREILDSEGKVIQPFSPKLKWDITKDALIHEYDEDYIQTGKMKTVEPWVVEMAQQGMRLVVTEGTADKIFVGEEIPSAGKTGTAEYCDNVAQSQNLCQPGSWPAHAWYFGYAPYDDPEIAVVAFVYNGTEGSTVAGPIVRKVIEGYFDLKSMDQAKGGQQP